jgi:hypothetical protein
MKRNMPLLTELKILIFWYSTNMPPLRGFGLIGPGVYKDGTPAELGINISPIPV